MSLATITAALLAEAGVSPDDILREAGVDREGAIKQLASKLGVDLNSLVDTPQLPEGDLREVSDDDVRRIRDALPALNRAFS